MKVPSYEAKFISPTERVCLATPVVVSANELLESLREMVGLVRSLEDVGTFKRGVFDGGLERAESAMASAEGK